MWSSLKLFIRQAESDIVLRKCGTQIQVSILESGWKVFLEIPIYIKDNSREEREHCGFRGENTGGKNYFCKTSEARSDTGLQRSSNSSIINLNFQLCFSLSFHNKPERQIYF